MISPSIFLHLYLASSRQTVWKVKNLFMCSSTGVSYICFSPARHRELRITIVIWRSGWTRNDRTGERAVRARCDKDDSGGGGDRYRCCSIHHMHLAIVSQRYELKWAAILETKIP